MEGKNKVWTTEQVNRLMELYSQYSSNTVAQMLGKSLPSVKSKIKALGLIKGRRHFTKDEDYVLHKLYKDTPSALIAFILDRSIHSIYHRADFLKLYKDPDYLHEINQNLGRKLSDHGRQFVFKKGHSPMNKGLKQKQYMSAEAIERTKATRFHKGRTNHNLLNEGDITIHKRKNRNTPPYKWIKTDGKMRMLHVVNWEREYGPVPEGLILAFRTPDTMNCEVSNLKLITREENMSRNSIHRYPEEIKQTIRLLSRINKKVKQHEK